MIISVLIINEVNGSRSRRIDDVKNPTYNYLSTTTPTAQASLSRSRGVIYVFGWVLPLRLPLHGGDPVT